jgi:hypothetical protein
LIAAAARTLSSMQALDVRPAPPHRYRFSTVARTYDEIDDHLRAWIGRQPMFFVGSAPLAADGHINVSPKGPGGTLRVLGPRRVAYLDYVGSGAETIAHVRENGRVVVMFCAFEGPPRIVRLHGRGEYVLTDDPRFDELLAEAGFEEPTIPEGRRAIVVVDITRIGSSCGYGVPLMDHAGERPHMDASTRKRVRVQGPAAYLDYQAEHNAASIDGLPAVTR